MYDPIVQSRAGFSARRSMVHYLEQELNLELQAAEQGLPLRETQPPPVLGAYVLTLGLVLSARASEWWSEVRRRRTAIPRVFFGEYS